MQPLPVCTGLTTCSDKPCFEGVKCTNVRIDVNDLDYENGGIAKRYQCGPCPVGFKGDGQECVGKTSKPNCIGLFSVLTALAQTNSSNIGDPCLIYS